MTLPIIESDKPLKIAIVGCGVAGMTAAWLLNRKHEVHLFEKNDYVGGHTRTLTIPDGPDIGTAVDTGFIVMNHRNYPLFTRVLEQLNIELADSSMTFSFYDQNKDYGYSGNTLSTLFPKLSYLLKNKHLSLIGNLWRFARVGYRDLNSGYLEGKSLAEYCENRGFSEAFLDNYLYPMGAAIWSSPVAQMPEFPAQPYLHFLENHGLLRLTNRPQWKYVSGGSRTYIQAMLGSFPNPPNLASPPSSIHRTDQGIVLKMSDDQEQRFDHVVIGTHADEALQLLADPSPAERANLAPWKYQANTVVLHTHAESLPQNRKLWSSWNFIREANQSETQPVSVSYYMNRLQNLQTQRDYIVTLNSTTRIPEEHIINKTTLMHPLYSFASMNTQPKLKAMNGKQNTWFCGSYFGYGFHEDAVRSAVQVANQFGIEL